MNENWLVVVEPKWKRNKEELRTVVALYSAKSKAAALRKYNEDRGEARGVAYKKPLAAVRVE